VKIADLFSEELESMMVMAPKKELKDKFNKLILTKYVNVYTVM